MNYTIQKIKPQHDAGICKIITSVGKEFGAIGEGFGPSDTEVESMSQYYSDENASCYLVARVGDCLVGGCGIAPFNHRDDVCELRKLFLLPESRGLGIGKNLMTNCLEYAKYKGYKKCYLDTLASMTQAIGLYKKLGFQHLTKPLEGTIHDGCDIWMLKDL